jgi:hypothetical protein
MDVVNDVGERSRRGLRIGREALLGVAHAERERLGRMIQFADPETWEQPSAAPGWWNRDVMAHLAANDTAAAQLMAGQPAEELEEYRGQLGEEPFTVDGWNAWAVGRRTGLTTREILETWGRAAGRSGLPRGSTTPSGGTPASRGWRAASPAVPHPVAGHEWFLPERTCARRTASRAGGRWAGSGGQSTCDRLWPCPRALGGRASMHRPGASFELLGQPGLVAVGPRLRRGPRPGKNRTW